MNNNKFIILFLATLFIFSSAMPAFSAKKSSLEEEFRWLEAEAITFTASRKEKKISETAAAAFVITNEDIRRMGVTSIPEALRTVPGIQVARLNANNWHVSYRGFNGRFTNKLLVQIDGRSVYTSLFGGVFWNTKDVMLEDVERIEIIRGPGAALWGANAVNGIINIITKNAEKTQGTLITGGYGNEEKGFGSLRYGGKYKEGIHYRGYIKYFNRDDYVTTSGENSNDQWQAAQGGFRIDGDLSDTDAFTFQGDIYNGEGGDLENVTTDSVPSFSTLKGVDWPYGGGNILGRWKRSFSDNSEAIVQLNYDRTEEQINFDKTFKATIDTYDIDMQHRFQYGEKHEITWGLAFRQISDNIQNAFSLSFDPASLDTQKYSVFFNDEITLIDNRLKLIIGSKLEHNNYTGIEIQPNGRLLWTPRQNHTVWGAISRAVVTPSRNKHYLNKPSQVFSYPPSYAIVVIEGHEEMVSEYLTAYELGYRFQPGKRVSVDIATFFNKYNNFARAEALDPYVETSTSTPYYALPFTVGNSAEAEAYGVEISSTFKAAKWWKNSGVLRMGKG